MRTIEWDSGGIVQVIDQRKLPLEYVVVEFTDYRDVATAIKEMYIRGAPAIGAAAAFGMALAANGGTSSYQRRGSACRPGIGGWRGRSWPHVPPP